MLISIDGGFVGGKQRHTFLHYLLGFSFGLGEHLAGEQVGYRWELRWTNIEKGLDAFGVLCRLLDMSAAYLEAVGLYELTMIANVCLYEEFEVKGAEMLLFGASVGASRPLPPRRQESAPASPQIGHRVSAASTSRELGEWSRDPR